VGVSPLRNEHTRQILLGIALELFAEQGYERTSLREIADAMGVTKAALYYHFPSKDALLMTIVRPMLDKVDSLLERFESGTRRADHRAELLSAYLDVLVEERVVVGFLVRDPAAARHAELGERFVEQQERLRALLAGPRSSVRANVYAVCALGALQGGASSFAGGQIEHVRQLILDAALSLLEAGR
jgi:AcrR family transcriptional regulator